MLQERLARAPRAARLTVRLAQSADEVRQAQKLRYCIFGEEMGARLASAEMGIDCDDYDALCDHLIVLNQASGEVIGTYRVLTPAQARRVGSTYSDTEFDLTRLRSLRQGSGKTRWLQTLKTAGTATAGLSQRGEWEAAVHEGQLDPVALQGTPWPTLDQDGQWLAQLAPCFETDSTRTPSRVSGAASSQARAISASVCPRAWAISFRALI